MEGLKDRGYTLSFATGSCRIYYIFTGERLHLTQVESEATTFNSRDAAESKAKDLKRRDVRIKTIDIRS